MSDGIWYKGKLIGSVHYFVYSEGKLPGDKRDIFVRLNNLRALEILLQLSPRSRLRVGGDDKSYEIRYEKFRRETLTRVRDIHIETNFLDSTDADTFLYPKK